jgi:hypothetical protein
MGENYDEADKKYCFGGFIRWVRRIGRLLKIRAGAGFGGDQRDGRNQTRVRPG